MGWGEIRSWPTSGRKIQIWHLIDICRRFGNFREYLWNLPRLVEWFELLTALGADQIFVYQLDVHSNVTKVLSSDKNAFFMYYLISQLWHSLNTHQVQDCLNTIECKGWIVNRTFRCRAVSDGCRGVVSWIHHSGSWLLLVEGESGLDPSDFTRHPTQPTNYSGANLQLNNLVHWKMGEGGV